LKGEFGTPDQPMLVPSFEPERLVGCQGTLHSRQLLDHFSHLDDTLQVDLQEPY
jgi:hypothetical protein